MSKSASVFGAAATARPSRSVRLFGRHEEREHAVGDLGGGAEAGRRDRGGIDFQAGARMYDGLERLAEASGTGAGVGNLIVLALVLERFLAGENLPDDRNIFFRARKRLAIGDAVPALDHLRAGRADAEKKASARERLQAHGGN